MELDEVRRRSGSSSPCKAAAPGCHGAASTAGADCSVRNSGASRPSLEGSCDVADATERVPPMEQANRATESLRQAVQEVASVLRSLIGERASEADDGSWPLRTPQPASPLRRSMQHRRWSQGSRGSRASNSLHRGHGGSSGSDSDDARDGDVELDTRQARPVHAAAPATRRKSWHGPGCRARGLGCGPRLRPRPRSMAPQFQADRMEPRAPESKAPLVTLDSFLGEEVPTFPFKCGSPILPAESVHTRQN